MAKLIIDTHGKQLSMFWNIFIDDIEVGQYITEVHLDFVADKENSNIQFITDLKEDYEKLSYIVKNSDMAENIDIQLAGREK